ncbi:MAG: metallophosphoesterase [Candidatus Competibacteraceae bacterium]|nr:metallophosphoesterase [Candidatus Competibacteraceae bacterium]
MPAPDDDQPIRILHLSDFHFTADKAWDAEPVLGDLAEFIAKEGRGGRVPDLVAITGDLAFSGTDEEYRLARDWLDEQLWPALPQDFPRDRLLLVPGNHDVDRKKVNFTAHAVQATLLSVGDQNQIAEILGDTEQRDVLLKRHAAYLAFLGDWLDETQPLPWWRYSIEIRGVRLHVAGLDSAWMACGDRDRGQLLLGRYQINQTVRDQDAKKADWRLALLHHPWDYFAEFDGHEARSTIHQHCDLLLRGHLHFPQTERVAPPDPSRACLELAAGCVYENSRYPNAFQWIELHCQPRRIKVLYRAWIQGAWAMDRNHPGRVVPMARLGLMKIS